MEYEKKYQELKNRILNIAKDDFEAVAVELFQFQYQFNSTYKEYCNALKIETIAIKSSSQIPFLPIQFFKSRTIKTGTFEEVAVFESSGTTGSISSKHFVKDLSIYESSFLQSFTEFYGDISEYCIIGLLPSYLERKGSSLVYMVDKLITLSAHENSGFYLYEFEALKSILELNEARQQKTLLIGVSYALLDFSEKFPMQLKHTLVMETGGMKGRREELSKQELHKQLKQNFPLKYFLGDNENAIKIQIYCALITNLLMTVIQKSVKRSWAFSNLVSFCRIHLFNYIHLLLFLENPDKDWQKQKNEAGQYALF